MGIHSIQLVRTCIVALLFLALAVPRVASAQAAPTPQPRTFTGGDVPDTPGYFDPATVGLPPLPEPFDIESVPTPDVDFDFNFTIEELSIFVSGVLTGLSIPRRYEGLQYILMFILIGVAIRVLLTMFASMSGNNANDGDKL